MTFFLHLFYFNLFLLLLSFFFLFLALFGIFFCLYLLIFEEMIEFLGIPLNISNFDVSDYNGSLFRSTLLLFTMRNNTPGIYWVRLSTHHRIHVKGLTFQHLSNQIRSQYLIALCLFSWNLGVDSSRAVYYLWRILIFRFWNLRL